MRMLLLSFAVFSTTLLNAQDVGDTVVVTADKRAELTEDGVVVTAIPTGAHVVIERVNEEAYWIRSQANYKGGWIRKDQVVPAEQAVEFFTQQIREDLTSRSYRCRGIAYSRRGDYENAVRDFTESIELNPTLADAWTFRANAYRELGEFDKSIEDCSEAIRLAPQWAASYTSRGIAWEKKGEYGKALADYSKVLELNPDDARGYNNRAWIWSTCPDSKYRDGEKAVESATKACELSKWSAYYALNTLGAAYAENGDFEKAVEYENRARELYPEEEKKRWEFLIALYQSGRPYHRNPGE